ncbi:uncharacterized protein YALI1_C15377g [Yarrowia lipolytica]|uniref:Uncharacterized protein n=1 Tax=Yarrowia lipolytica TaxID=4952 RepID=A0A1D8NAK4_YARLL|nr:hypothetical protein YALI1_C15377g [Yarrowia lipolytica]
MKRTIHQTGVSTGNTLTGTINRTNMMISMTKSHQSGALAWCRQCSVESVICRTFRQLENFPLLSQPIRVDGIYP